MIACEKPNFGLRPLARAWAPGVRIRVPTVASERSRRSEEAVIRVPWSPELESGEGGRKGK